MSIHEIIQKEIKIKYTKKLERELAKPNPNQMQVEFLKSVLKRIESEELFN